MKNEEQPTMNKKSEKMKEKCKYLFFILPETIPKYHYIVDYILILLSLYIFVRLLLYIFLIRR